MNTIDALLSAVESGKLSPGPALYKACSGDPWKYGQVMLKVVEKRKASQKPKETEDVMKNFQKELIERQYEFTTKVSCESNAAAAAGAGEADTRKPEGVQGDGSSEKPSTRKRKGTPKVKSRRKVPKEVRVQGDEQEEAEGDVSGYGCFRDCFQRLGRLCVFWKSS